MFGRCADREQAARPAWRVIGQYAERVPKKLAVVRQLARIFKMYDEDGNGIIDREEYVAANMLAQRALLGLRFDAERARDVALRDWEEDRDGSVVIARPGLYAAWFQVMAWPPRSPLRLGNKFSTDDHTTAVLDK